MPRIIAITNQKGGVGKTTTAVNLGASLASADLRILVVDLDPQGNTTSALGVDKHSLRATIYDVLMGNLAVEQCAQQTDTANLELLPANRDLTGATVELLSDDSGAWALRRVLRSKATDPYDYVLIDCPPSLGILTLCGLVAADSVLVPIQCEYFALEGLSELYDTLERVQGHMNSALEVEGILLTMYDERLNLASQIQQNVRGHLGDRVLSTVIPRNVRLAEAPSFGKPIILYDPRSKGAQSYLQLARELVSRHRRATMAQA